MKKIIYLFLTATIFCYNNSNAQDERKVESFEITENNPYLINQFVVINKESMAIEEGFKLVNEWINLTYNTPTIIIKSKIENDYIKIEVKKTNSPCFNLKMTTCYDSNYFITFAFKQDKIKFQVTRLQLNSPKTRSSSGGWSNYNPTYTLLHKKSFIKKAIEKRISIADGLMTSINDLKNDLEKYINNPIKKETSKSDW
jgi:hypothetical protein